MSRFYGSLCIRRLITSQWLKIDLLGSAQNILFQLYFGQVVEQSLCDSWASCYIYNRSFSSKFYIISILA